MIVVASVHHTGTNFVWQNLLEGMTQVGMSPTPNALLDNAFTRIHCDLDQHGYLKWWLKRCLCIVPLRHPLSVAASWKARDKDLHNLAIQWKILKEKVDPYGPMYMPLDVPDRSTYLDAISEAVGHKLHTEWPVIMSCKKSATLNADERAGVAEVMDDGFFEAFGYVI